MGLTVKLEDERGTVLESVGDPKNILHRVLPPQGSEGYHCLGYIDWYDVTVFNKMQAARFLEEWENLEPTLRTPEARELFGAIARLARKCREQPHLYLKFYGD
jgi:hypothetical protein